MGALEGLGRNLRTDPVLPGAGDGSLDATQGGEGLLARDDALVDLGAEVTDDVAGFARVLPPVRHPLAGLREGETTLVVVLGIGQGLESGDSGGDTVLVAHTSFLPLYGVWLPGNPDQ